MNLCTNECTFLVRILVSFQSMLRIQSNTNSYKLFILLISNIMTSEFINQSKSNKLNDFSSNY